MPNYLLKWSLYYPTEKSETQNDLQWNFSTVASMSHRSILNCQKTPYAHAKTKWRKDQTLKSKAYKSGYRSGGAREACSTCSTSMPVQETKINGVRAAVSHLRALCESESLLAFLGSCHHSLAVKATSLEDVKVHRRVRRNRMVLPK